MLEATPENIALVRKAMNLTQREAAALAGLAGAQAHVRWSQYERGAQPFNPALWELFLIKTGNHPHYRRIEP